MLDALITSKTRIKMLVRFFLDPANSGYLRGLAGEFGDSTNSVRLELNRMEEAGLLKSHASGGKKLYRANSKHPLFPDIQSIVRKYIGMDELIEGVINQLGDPTALYLVGDLAKGIDSPDMSLIIVGNNIDHDFLESLVAKTQKTIGRHIRYAIFTPEEFDVHHQFLDSEKTLQVWEK